MVDFDKAIDSCFIKQNNSTQIADWFIKQASNEKYKGTILTQLKLQKLLYYSYVWWLVIKNKRLFSENIEAWEYGPVVRAQYTRLKKYDNKTIKLQELETDLEQIPLEIKQHLEMIWDKYGKYEAHYLVDKTHQEKPWLDAFNSNDKKKIITDEMIKDYYKIEMLNHLL